MPNSVEKTMLILRTISDFRGNPVTLSRLSEITGINKSTAAHILKTLSSLHYVRRVSHTEGYVIGAELHFLTRYGRYGEDIIGECHPILEYLNRESGAAAVFAVLDGGNKYIIDRVTGDRIYSDSDASILGDDLYRTVTGRVLLAHSAPDEAVSIYNTLGAPKECEWQNAATRGEFTSRLAEIRKLQVYYIESESGGYIWHSFASPVFKDKKCVGALGLAIKRESSNQQQFTDREKYGAMMLKCKRELERRLKFL